MNDIVSATTLARPAEGTVNELQRIVLVNEHIKAVVKTAFAINLMALNAIFLAKRAGQSALGFGVLSNELRAFAVDLAEIMKTVRGLTGASVHIVSGQVRRARTLKTLKHVQAQEIAHAQAALESAVGRYVGELQQYRVDLRNQQRTLQESLAEVRQRVELGGVLARSAKIEAAYGGVFASSLMQVASDFDKTIEAIRSSLDALSKL